MAMTNPFETVSFQHGPSAKNRFMLAPLTNQQSQADGVLSDEEFRWLTMRAAGGFGITTTCASHVQASGQGFPGQLGSFSEAHLDGLTRLAEGIKAHGSVAILQLHHAGMRAPRELTGEAPVAPYADDETDARALTTSEIEEVITSFIDAARRADRAGFDGVELHGAHGYLLCEFLEPERNRRDDAYGGTLENRCRIFVEIINGIRRACREDFHVALRLSPERFGMSTSDVLAFYRQLVAGHSLDMIDLSLWDVFKEAIDDEFVGRTLLELFADVNRGTTRLAGAGKLHCGADVRRALDAGLDLVIVGRAAITNHNFPHQVLKNPDFAMRTLPVSAELLRREGLSDQFVNYMRGWRGFVSEDARE